MKQGTASSRSMTFAAACFLLLIARADAEQIIASGELRSHTAYAAVDEQYTNSNSQVSASLPVAVQLSVPGISADVEASYGFNRLKLATDQKLVQTRADLNRQKTFYAWGGFEAGLDSFWTDTFTINSSLAESGTAVFRFSLAASNSPGVYYQLYINDFFYSDHPIYSTSNGFYNVVLPFTNGAPVNLAAHLTVLGSQTDSIASGDFFSSPTMPEGFHLDAQCQLDQILLPPAATLASASGFAYSTAATSSTLELSLSPGGQYLSLHWIGSPQYSHVETTTNLSDPGSWQVVETSSARVTNGFDNTFDFLPDVPVRFFQLVTVSH